MVVCYYVLIEQAVVDEQMKQLGRLTHYAFDAVLSMSWWMYL